MLDRIFNADNVVFRFFSTLGYVWWLHILWLICSLPVITLGASTTALCYSCMKLRKQEGYATKNFFTSFRENFKQSTILFLLFAAAGGVLIADIILSNQMGNQMGRLLKGGAVVLLVPYSITLLYVFAVQARFVNPVAKTIQYAFVLASRYFGYTIQLAILAGLALYLNTTIILANFITLSIGIGVLAYFMSAYYNRIFAHYIPEEKEPEELGETEENT